MSRRRRDRGHMSLEAYALLHYPASRPAPAPAPAAKPVPCGPTVIDMIAALEDEPPAAKPTEPTADDMTIDQLLDLIEPESTP